MKDFTEIDLTKYKGGLVLVNVDIGKMRPDRAKTYLNHIKKELEPITAYLKSCGFYVMFLAQSYADGKDRGTQFQVWGMNKPYRPSLYEGETRDFDMAKSAI